MAELLPQERLQPSLLDRLTDDEPTKPLESRQQRVLPVSRLRELVLRDLGWLLNTGCLGQMQDLSGFPHAYRSVLNYGVPDLSGLTVSSMDLPRIEQALRQAILNFEPRILPRRLQVRMVTDVAAMSHNAVTFEIQGELWAQPLPLHLYLKTLIDLETGAVFVTESEGT